jgi:putative transposase
VLFNVRKHDRAHGHHAVWMGVLDPCSSAPWFDGFDPRAGQRLPVGKPRRWSAIIDTSPVEGPRSWLARTGWKRHGLIKATEEPKPTAIR